MVKILIHHPNGYEQFEVNEAFTKVLDKLGADEFPIFTIDGQRRAYSTKQIACVYDMSPPKDLLVKHELPEENNGQLTI